MTNPILNGPQAPESNPPIEPQYFQPNQFVISNIQRGIVTTVTLDQTFYGAKNNFVVGQLVRFIIPETYGIRQLNEQLGYVIGIPSENQVNVNINTTINYDNFVASPSYGPTPPQLLPVGDVNTGRINTDRSRNGTYIEGSFINISPR